MTDDPVDLGTPVQIDHVGIAVRDLEAAIHEYRNALGLEPVHRERVEDQGVDEALFQVGASFIQLLAPTGPDTPVGRFLERRGEGVPHAGYRVRAPAANPARAWAAPAPPRARRPPPG